MPPHTRKPKIPIRNRILVSASMSRVAGGVTSLMRLLRDQLQVLRPLRVREMREDLAPHDVPQRIDARVDVLPDAVPLGLVADQDRADRVPLQGIQLQLPRQIV